MFINKETNKSVKRENNREYLAGQEGGWFRESHTGEQDKERLGG